MSEKELELSAKSADLDSAIRANHTALPPAAAGISALSARRKRLIYRAKQRGWLEVDLLLGTFAHREVPGMSEAEMDEFEQLVNLETIDIYNILTLRAKPDAVDNGVVRRVVEWVETNPLGTASAEDYRKVKAEAGLT
jgi:succinate dehydrogenase flavin-adding protein (antitoxin of CptAB toxin-antitoxin module)